MSGSRGFALAWGAALAAVWLLRPPLAPDELRYLAVAWEMHDRDVWLVPLLNGEPYSHKPPLMFWLWRAAWLPFGPSLLAARVLQAIAALSALLLTARLARGLAPGDARLPAGASLVLGGSLALQAYSGFLGFDVWLTVAVLLAWLGLVRAIPPAHGAPPAPRTGWCLFAIGLAAALLTKGPAAAIAVLPPALLHPWWSGVRSGGTARWLGLLAATAGGAALALAWALPAAHTGGDAYGHAILWGQTAGRVRDSFAHARPFWFYLPVLAVLLAPWVGLPALWRRTAATVARPPARFALAALLPGLLLFSSISGKQPHYLLPLLPAGALLIAGLLLRGGATGARRLARWALAAPLLALAANLAFGLGWGARWDLRPAAEATARAQAAGRAVALYGMAYHGQFHFLGRLHAPIADPAGPAELRAWLRAHPDGVVAHVLPRVGGTPVVPDGTATLAFGTRRLVLLDAAALLAPPAAASR